jgi:hypothetical protein
MKFLVSILFSLAVMHANAADKPAAAPPGQTVKGEVLETLNAAGFTYLRLKTKDGESWAAVRATPIKTGTQVTLENVIPMKNFESKSLKKTFPVILLGDLAGAPSGAQAVANEVAAAHSDVAKQSGAPDEKVAKATGANARTVAEIMTKSAELKDKPALIRAKVVKYNAGIMGKNWVHLRDGSGSAADQTNDLMVTTASETRVGDVVVMQGVVRTDKNFGAGYAYKVMLEDATLRK